MITLTLSSPPDYVRALQSQDVRELCIQAENTIRLWTKRGRPPGVAIVGGTPAQRAHIEDYLHDVQADLRPIAASGGTLWLKR